MIRTGSVATTLVHCVTAHVVASVVVHFDVADVVVVVADVVVVAYVVVVVADVVAVIADVVAVVADVVVVAYVAVVVVADGIKVTLEKAKLLLRLLHDSQIFLLPPQFSQRGPIQQK